MFSMICQDSDRHENLEWIFHSTSVNDDSEWVTTESGWHIVTPSPLLTDYQFQNIIEL